MRSYRTAKTTIGEQEYSSGETSKYCLYEEVCKTVGDRIRGLKNEEIGTDLSK